MNVSKSSLFLKPETRTQPEKKGAGEPSDLEPSVADLPKKKLAVMKSKSRNSKAKLLPPTEKKGSLRRPMSQVDLLTMSESAKLELPLVAAERDEGDSVSLNPRAIEERKEVAKGAREKTSSLFGRILRREKPKNKGAKEEKRTKEGNQKKEKPSVQPDTIFSEAEIKPDWKFDISANRKIIRSMVTPEGKVPSLFDAVGLNADGGLNLNMETNWELFESLVSSVHLFENRDIEGREFICWVELARLYRDLSSGNVSPEAISRRMSDVEAAFLGALDVAFGVASGPVPVNLDNDIKAKLVDAFARYQQSEGKEDEICKKVVFSVLKANSAASQPVGSIWAEFLGEHLRDPE